MPLLEVRHIGKGFGSGRQARTVAIQDISFVVQQREFVSLLGPSGCGKTTLLTMMAGLLEPSSGRVVLKDETVSGPRDGLIMVFQQYASSLFPWRTNIGNVAYGLERIAHLGARDREERARHYLEIVGLTGFEHHYPWQLSGGMQQRVAIARALACEPDILLLDEPFASVDAQTRSDLEDLLLRLWSTFQQTVVFVTHDIEEAIYLADRVLVLGPRPATLVDEVTVSLPRPRDQLATKEHPDFLRYRHRLYERLRPGSGAASEVV